MLLPPLVLLHEYFIDLFLQCFAGAVSPEDTPRDAIAVFFRRRQHLPDILARKIVMVLFEIVADGNVYIQNRNIRRKLFTVIVARIEMQHDDQVKLFFFGREQVPLPQQRIQRVLSTAPPSIAILPRRKLGKMRRKGKFVPARIYFFQQGLYSPNSQ